MSSSKTQTMKRLRIGMTLDIQPDKVEEYIAHHDNSWPEIEGALREVGMRNLSLFVYGERLFYYAEYVGEEPFEQAMERYAKMPRVQEWEKLMQTFQKKLEGSKGDIWWQPMRTVYHQD